MSMNTNNRKGISSALRTLGSSSQMQRMRCASTFGANTTVPISATLVILVLLAGVLLVHPKHVNGAPPAAPSPTLTPSPLIGTNTDTPTSTLSPTTTPTITDTWTPTHSPPSTYTHTPTNTLTPARTDSPTPTYTETTIPPAVGELDLKIFKLDGAQLGNDEEGQPPDEQNVGSMMCVNLDNDDGSIAKDDFDINDDVVVGENDLVKIRLIVKSAPSPANRVKLSITIGGERVRVWTNRTKITQVALPVTYRVDETPVTLWIEGIAGSGTERDVEFRFEPVDFLANTDQVNLTVINVNVIKFIGKGNSNNDDDKLDKDPHPNAALGTVRVFPDKRLAGAGANAGPEKRSRDRVKVRIRLSSSVPFDLELFLKSFDVDDPSGDTAPLDNENKIGDQDNRGFVRGSRAGKFTKPDTNDDLQDTEGIARLLFAAHNNEKVMEEFQVTRQPGDNFRIAVSCERDFLKQLRNKDKEDDVQIVDQNNLRPILGWTSPVLTVWRRLHIEVDSMGAPPGGTRFNPGDEDPGDIPEPNTGKLAQTFRSAYIAVKRVTNWDDGATPWNYSFDWSLAKATAYAALHRKSPDGDRDWWSAYVIGVYEGPAADPAGTRLHDNDPNGEVGFDALTYSRKPEYTLIYTEIDRDLAMQHAWNGDQRKIVDQGVVVHEIGHHFGLPERGGQNPQQCLPPDNIMWGPCSDQDETNYPSVPFKFVPEDLDTIRDTIGL